MRHIPDRHAPSQQELQDPQGGVRVEVPTEEDITVPVLSLLDLELPRGRQDLEALHEGSPGVVEEVAVPHHETLASVCRVSVTVWRTWLRLSRIMRPQGSVLDKKLRRVVQACLLGALLTPLQEFGAVFHEQQGGEGLHLPQEPVSLSTVHVRARGGVVGQPGALSTAASVSAIFLPRVAAHQLPIREPGSGRPCGKEQAHLHRHGHALKEMRVPEGPKGCHGRHHWRAQLRGKGQPRLPSA